MHHRLDETSGQSSHGMARWGDLGRDGIPILMDGPDRGRKHWEWDDGSTVIGIQQTTDFDLQWVHVVEPVKVFWSLIE